jgi:hypothetical protein
MHQGRTNHVATSAWEQQQHDFSGVSVYVQQLL